MKFAIAVAAMFGLAAYVISVSPFTFGDMLGIAELIVDLM